MAFFVLLLCRKLYANITPIFVTSNFFVKYFYQMAKIKARLLNVADYYGLSIRKFEERCGLIRGNISNMGDDSAIGSDKLSKIIAECREINLTWLLSGDGPMLRPDDESRSYAGEMEVEDLAGERSRIVTDSGKICERSKNVAQNFSKTKTPNNLTIKQGKEQGKEMVRLPKLQNSLPCAPTELPTDLTQVTHAFPSITDRSIQEQLIPIYDIEASAGFIGLFEDDISSVPIKYLYLPDLPRVDGAIYARGDSMDPLIGSGDIVVFKRILDTTHIHWGEMYIVEYVSDDGDYYIAVKFIQKVEGDNSRALLVSKNPRNEPVEIGLSSIRSLALVKASVKYHTMG